MSNINISNGTCYTAAGQKLDSSFIPCGNAAFGYQTCCGAGDNCLADLACFGVHGSGYGSFLTYYAGCTDPNYKDASCPSKEVDQPWVALTLCDNSDGAWAICSQSGNPSTLQPGSFCSCTNSASATIAFKDATVLANFASLPASTGESISFFAGHSPTNSQPTSGPTGNTGTTAAGGSTGGGSSSSETFSGTSVSAGTSASASRSSSGAQAASKTTSSSTSSATEAGGAGASPSGNSGSGKSNSKSNGIGTGALVGIIVGAVIAVLLLAVLAFFYFRRRRRNSHIAAEKKLRNSGMSSSPMKPGGLGEYVRPGTPPMSEVEGIPVAEIAGQPAKPYMLRSELDGKEVPNTRTAGPGYINELEGSSAPVEFRSTLSS